MNGHQSLKIAKDPAKMWAHGITQFEYTITDTLWYDTSLIDCVTFGADGSVDGSDCAGYDGGIHLEATGGTCAVATLPANTHDNTQAYFVPDDNLATKSCLTGQAGGDATMTLCSGGGSKAKRSIAGRIAF